MADTQTVHPSLSGVLAPVRSEDDFELDVVGRFPDAPAGAYYRNGPNPQCLGTLNLSRFYLGRIP